jgi:hypothetical protein
MDKNRIDQTTAARYRLEAVEAWAYALCEAATPRRRPEPGGAKPLAAHMAPGGSATALRWPSRCPMPSSARSASQPWRPNMLLNLPNRRIRTRIYGGVGGAEPRGSPLSRFALGSMRGIASRKIEPPTRE